MINYLPTPYENESFYSLLSRFHVRIGSSSTSTTVDFIYEKKVNIVNVEFPIQLQQFLKNIPSQYPYSFRDWLLNHSSLLYYSPFLPNKKFDVISKAMEEGTLATGKLSHYIGLDANSVKNQKYLRFCNQCLKESIKKQGEGYWNIMHQLPGVRLCHIHATNLCISNVPLNKRYQKDFFVPLTNNVAVRGNEWIPKIEKDFYLYLVRETFFLLNQPFQLIDNAKLHNWYKQKFLAKNWMSLKYYRFNRQKFVDEMYRVLPATFVKEYTMDLNDVDWMTNLLANNYRGFVHPLRYLALNYMLGCSMKELFYDEVKEFQPFGTGPWICQNPVCLFHNISFIEDITIRRDKTDYQPVGIFECPYCEFIYTRKGCDKTVEDKYKRSRVLNYGTLFKKELLYLVPNCNYNFLAVSRIMKINRKTLKKWYLLWRKDLANDNTFKEDQHKMHSFWLNKLNKHPDQGRSYFKKNYSKEYQWIYRNDPDWLEEHFPQPMKISSKKRKKEGS